VRTHAFTVHVEPAGDGGFVATVPALAGCVTQGDGFEQTLERAQEAIQGYLEALHKAGEPIPVEPAPHAAVDTRVVVRISAA